MSDSDDDYMSDKILIGCEKTDVRPGLLFSKNQKRSHELYKKQAEERTAKKPKTYREQEKETREMGLNTAISSENIGFKLMEKMGYKAGGSLGKTEEGIKEPVNVIVKETTSGIGREQHVIESSSSRRMQKEVNLRMQEHQFRAANMEKNLMWVLKNDYYKAQHVCVELDCRNNIEVPVKDYFWPAGSKKKLEVEVETDSEEEEEEDEEEITETKLQLIIDYLRETYLYCLYCVSISTDEQDLELNCPGPYRTDHDDNSD